MVNPAAITPVRIVSRRPRLSKASRRAVLVTSSAMMNCLAAWHGHAGGKIPRLLQVRAVAVDVIGLAGETGAVAADDRLQRLVEPAVVGVDGGEPVARRRRPLAQLGEVDSQRPAVLDDDAAADHDTVDRGAVLAVDELVDRIVERQPVR